MRPAWEELCFALQTLSLFHVRIFKVFIVQQRRSVVKGEEAC